jgi:2-isopropylmalate synthase
MSESEIEMEPERLIVFDTTLRDGEQCPGASLNIKEKLEVARQLSLLKVDVIEAGFPVASPGDFQAVETIAKEIRNASIAGLARAYEKDIVAAAQALEKAESPRIHVFLSTSKSHRTHMVKKAKEEIVTMAMDAVKMAKKYVDDVEFSPMDASRTEEDFLATVLEAVIGVGATTVNIPDTVGYAIPEQFGDLISYIKKNVSNIDKSIISVHCHNDLGLAVANSLAAVRAGARQVECTVNGIGERAGNAAMEEIVMALKTRKNFYQVDTQIETKHIMACSKMVSSLTGFFVQRNKAIVGKNAFAHESGIHQHGFLKKKDTFEIMDPKHVGADDSELVMGKHSGRAALAHKVKELMGYEVSQEDLDILFDEFKILADEKKEIFDEDIVSLIHKQKLEDDSLVTYRLGKFKCSFETGGAPQAEVELLGKDGAPFSASAEGDGPVDAIYNCIDKISGLQCKLLDYQVMSKTKGQDAQGEVTVLVLNETRESLGKGSSLNTLEASAEAYVDAINKLLFKRKSGPVESSDIPGP